MLYRKLIADTIARELIDSKIKIPSLPDSAPALLSMMNQPLDQIDLLQLESLIKSDPVLFAQLIKLANSPYYRTSVEVTGLRTAIMRIGLVDTIHSLYGYLFKNTLPAFPNIEGFSDKEFWEESWACAIACRRLGDPRLMVSVRPGELYISGLLHGIGRLILAVYDPLGFRRCIETATNFKARTLEDAELEIFKTTDSLVAGAILEWWKIPENICAGVSHWQHPGNSPPEYREIASLVQFGCSIVRLSGIIKGCPGMDSASTGSSLEDISSTYLLSRGEFPIAEGVHKYRLVQEVVSILDKSLNSSNNHEKNGAPVPGAGKRKKVSSGHDKNSKRNNKGRNHIEKKGFWDWLKKFFV
ncbi:MAG: HDOD domain-containing protein [Desulfamplus sp.]|nr:HDOD domain-containing protein [Desulfamplus sp.]